MTKSKKPFQLPNRQHNLFQGLVDRLMVKSSVALCFAVSEFGGVLVSFALCMTVSISDSCTCAVSGLLMQSFV